MMSDTYEGQIVRGASGRLYLINQGRRRYIGSMEIFESQGFDERHIVDIPPEHLELIPRGPEMPYRWTRAQFLEPPVLTKPLMRELLVSQIRGTGIEFGPGPAPFALPVGAGITYADWIELAVQRKRLWPEGEDEAFMPVDVRDSFDQMASIGSGSVDFILASHVIEHVKDPLGTLHRAYDRLRPGGLLCLVIPDRRYYLADSQRTPTTLEHVVLDSELPSDARDFEHYIDFYKVNQQCEDYRAMAEDAARNGLDVHFHVWDLEAFYDMVQHSRAKAPWSEVLFWPKLPEDGACDEFYFVLRK